jgi:hypothetical protein
MDEGPRIRGCPRILELLWVTWVDFMQKINGKIEDGFYWLVVNQVITVGERRNGKFYLPGIEKPELDRKIDQLLDKIPAPKWPTS